MSRLVSLTSNERRRLMGNAYVAIQLIESSGVIGDGWEYQRAFDDNGGFVGWRRGYPHYRLPSEVLTSSRYIALRAWAKRCADPAPTKRRRRSRTRPNRR